MTKLSLMVLFLLSLAAASQSHAGEVPKFTDADLQRYNETPSGAPMGNRAAPVPSRQDDVSGTWKFVCCSGKYWGEIVLAVDEHNAITGRFYDRANNSGGVIEGTVKGKTVLFSRNKGEQDYKLTLSDDGATMSGFFVGVHDGSVGTEVTMIRGSVQPPVEGAFTLWKEAEPFGAEMDINWKNGFYPARVEGRHHAGRNQFRASVRPFPTGVWRFFWWYGQSAQAYEEQKRKMLAEGFQEISLQVFTDSKGVRMYQTCWIKYGQ